MKDDSFNINSFSTVTRNTELIHSIIDDEVVILSILNEEYYNLNIIGSQIWNYIDTPKRIVDIIDMLEGNYEVSKNICENETIEFITELIDLGIIKINE